MLHQLRQVAILPGHHLMASAPQGHANPCLGGIKNQRQHGLGLLHLRAWYSNVCIAGSPQFNHCRPKCQLKLQPPTHQLPKMLSAQARPVRPSAAPSTRTSYTLLRPRASSFSRQQRSGLWSCAAAAGRIFLNLLQLLHPVGCFRQFDGRLLTYRFCYAGPVAPPVLAEPAPAISVSPKALIQLKKLRAEAAESGSSEESLILRVGVKQGGCSGLSYKMDFEQANNVSGDDHVMAFDAFRLVIDPKSLLYLFGMQMDFSDALIGGGFQFHNPNATDACGWVRVQRVQPCLGFPPPTLCTACGGLSSRGSVAWVVHGRLQ